MRYLVLAVGLLGTHLTAGIVLQLAPTTQTIALGDKAAVEILVSGLGDGIAPSLGTFDLRVSFNPQILSYSTASFGDPLLGDQLDPTGQGGTITAAEPAELGAVELFELSLDGASELDLRQASAFQLAQLLFNSIGAGNTSLTLDVNALGNADGASLNAGLENARVAVGSTAVPEPASASLILLGIGMCCLIKQKTNRHRIGNQHRNDTQ